MRWRLGHVWLIVVTSSYRAELSYWQEVNVHFLVVTKICVTPSLG